MRGILLGIPLEIAFKEPPIANTAIAEIVFSEQKPTLVRWNNMTYIMTYITNDAVIT